MVLPGAKRFGRFDRTYGGDGHKAVLLRKEFEVMMTVMIFQDESFLGLRRMIPRDLGYLQCARRAGFVNIYGFFFFQSEKIIIEKSKTRSKNHQKSSQKTKPRKNEKKRKKPSSLLNKKYLMNPFLRANI